MCRCVAVNNRWLLGSSSNTGTAVSITRRFEGRNARLVLVADERGVGCPRSRTVKTHPSRILGFPSESPVLRTYSCMNFDGNSHFDLTCFGLMCFSVMVHISRVLVGQSRVFNLHSTGNSDENPTIGLMCFEHKGDSQCVREWNERECGGPSALNFSFCGLGSLA